MVVRSSARYIWLGMDRITTTIAKLKGELISKTTPAPLPDAKNKNDSRMYVAMRLLLVALIQLEVLSISHQELQQLLLDNAVSTVICTELVRVLQSMGLLHKKTSSPQPATTTTSDESSRRKQKQRSNEVYIWTGPSIASIQPALIPVVSSSPQPPPRVVREFPKLRVPVVLPYTFDGLTSRTTAVLGNGTMHAKDTSFDHDEHVAKRACIADSK